MHVVFLVGILFSVMLASPTSGGKIIHQAKNVSRHHNSSDDMPSFVIHQYIGHNSISDDSITKLDEKLKRILALLQDKVGTPRNEAINAGPATTCKEIYEQNRSRGNGAYLLRMDYMRNIPVYCHMTKAGLGQCGGGGWSLVMKINGEKQTFHYDSQYWTSKEPYNLEGGETGLDTKETMLPTYWNTPFSKICLGMKIGHRLKFLVINKHANSLRSLIADGKYRNTSFGPDTWKTLIGPEAFLQSKCNNEGFNVKGYRSKTRIGIIGSADSCFWGYSRLGFGTGGDPDDSNTCGNVARYGNKPRITAMGYILVQ